MSYDEQQSLQAIAAEMIAMSERDQTMRKSGQWDSKLKILSMLTRDAPLWDWARWLNILSL